MLELGAHIINDVTAGLHDPRMLETVAQYAVPYIAMHIKGMPDTMQHDPVYNNVVDDVWDYFVDRVNAATDAGITDIILDPGFGFGKTLKHNYTLLNNLEKFTLLGLPIAIGISRKSMISGLLHANRDELLPAVSALHLKALEMGVKILRVHDVRAARQVVRLYRFLLDGHQ
jgi:dihydropteroate synthase